MSNLKSIDISDYLEEGVIVIDKSGIVELYNKAAKDIFGLSLVVDKGHDIGRIQNGDFVLIVDSMFGLDDGGLVKSDLNKIGINEIDISNDQGLLCYGYFNTPDKLGQYKIIQHQKKGYYSLTQKIDNLEFTLSLDTEKKYTNIIVNGENFKLPYIKSIGHMVIIRNNSVIFYQDKGYTTRGEAIKDILEGKEFNGKGEDYQINPLGKYVNELHPHNRNIEDFIAAAAGKDLSYDKRFLEINQRPVLASLTQIKEEDKTEGAILLIEDISQYQSALSERDEAIDKLRELEDLYQEIDLFPSLIGNSSVMQSVKDLGYRASQTDTTVLILGDSGTGKTYLANKIHTNSTRKDYPFISINCAAIPRELMESELFGYEKNSFTGASSKGKKGLIEMADGGTVFFDEIGDIPMFIQAKLLHFLQSKSFLKVGATEETTVDVRIISATNKDLFEEVKEKRFREDLYYRINVIPITMPSLKDRREDIPLLINYIFENLKTSMNMKDKALSIEAMNLLALYDFPGNVRELENILQRSISLSFSRIIRPQDLMIGNKSFNIDYEDTSLKTMVARFEKEIIQKFLAKNHNNARKTYKELEMGKTNFYKKLKDYNIRIE